MTIRYSILAELDVHDYRTEQELFDWCKCTICKFKKELDKLEKEKKIFKKNGKWYHSKKLLT